MIRTLKTNNNEKQYDFYIFVPKKEKIEQKLNKLFKLIYIINTIIFIVSLLIIFIAGNKDNNIIFMSLLVILFLDVYIFVSLLAFKDNIKNRKIDYTGISNKQKNIVNLFILYDLLSLFNNLNLFSMDINIPSNGVSRKYDDIECRYIKDNIRENQLFRANIYYWDKDFFNLEVDENYIPNLYIPFDWEENKNEKWSVLI
jgi:hypothetical protein